MMDQLTNVIYKSKLLAGTKQRGNETFATLVCYSAKMSLILQIL